MKKLLIAILLGVTFSVSAVEMRWYGSTSDKPQNNTITYTGDNADSIAAAYLIKTNATASNTMTKTVGNGSGKSNFWSAATTVSGSGFCDSIYVTIQVKSGYTFTPTSITSFVGKVAGTATFKGFIKDNNGHEITSSSSSSTATDGVDISFASLATAFSGTIKIGLAYYSGETKTKNAYLKNNLQIVGRIAAACTAITPTFSDDYSSTTLTAGGSNSSTPVIDKDGSSGAITWTSSNTSYATVDENGVVTPVAAGSARITATVAANGSYCSGSVYKDFTISAGSCNDISPSLSYASTTLSVGGTSATPDVSGNTGSGAVTYSVTSASPAGCVTVNGSTGVVTAVKVGTATITASIAAAGGYCENTATANFTVNCATPTIATQPVADTHCQTDDDHVLSVTPTAQTGASWSYQWQKSTDNGSSEAFANIGGATSSSYTVPDATLLADTDKQIYYRCVVTCNTGSKTVNSNSVAVKALLTPGLSISLKP